MSCMQGNPLIPFLLYELWWICIACFRLAYVHIYQAITWTLVMLIFRNTKWYFIFLSSPNIEMDQVVEILLSGSQGPTPLTCTSNAMVAEDLAAYVKPLAAIGLVNVCWHIPFLAPDGLSIFSAGQSQVDHNTCLAYDYFYAANFYKIGLSRMSNSLPIWSG